jgi:thiamine-phosphate pyrophosphorylase
MAGDMERPQLHLDVYVITSAGLWPGWGHREVGIAAIEGGASAVQLRAPELEGDRAAFRRLASELAARCCQAGRLFIVNNLLDVAIEVGADGVHLGQGDDPGAARAKLGPDRVLGVSVQDPDQAKSAERAGADYLGVTVWSTATKPDAKPIGLDGLRAVVEATSLPVVGIGGIDASNAAAVLAAGATGVAVVSAVGAAADPVAATRALVEAVQAFRAGNPAR